ncbi:hypothetical protein E4U41_000261 [Claviceps citrina]|nr:hypothetical protein E4U41_000261 [Claviceps citrina]
MAESGAAAYEVLTASMQSDRLFHVDIDSGLGRNPSAVPRHLSRVLYVPKHSMLNLCLYDARVPYQKAIDTSPFGSEHLVGRPLMGSRLFKTRLNALDRAAVMRDGAAPHHVVDLDVDKIRDGGDISATVRGRASAGDADGRAPPEMNITLPMLTDVFSLTVADTSGQSQHVQVSTRHPLWRLKANAGVIRFPYFGFSLQGDGPVHGYEWQIHPLDHGTLRYTLLRVRSHAQPGREAPSLRHYDDADIVAIYHHLGHDGSLFLPTSEGVLLLPALEAETSPLLEMAAVASLVGLLWRIRGMEAEEEEAEPRARVQRGRSLVKRMFGGRHSSSCLVWCVGRENTRRSNP